jgi:hypothetical protein
MPLPHPWRRLREAAHVTLRWHADGPMGWCRHSTQEISIRLGLTQAQRRVTVLHELEHLAGGPAVVGFAHVDERATQLRTAKWLITTEALAKAMLWSRDEYEIAEELWVDVHTVRDRLASLTPAETRLLNQLLDDAELQLP